MGSAFDMAYISTNTLPKTAHSSQSRAVSCSAEHPHTWQSPRIPAAALLMSAALFTITPALADDYPLVFDHDQTLGGANFDNRDDLKGAIFSKANCRGASFVGSDLSGAQLDDANMMEANLEGSTLVSITATKTKFQRANLKNADFTNANLVSALFDGADIEGADFTDSLLDRTATAKLCKIAKGVHPKTGVPTAESLMCPE